MRLSIASPWLLTIGGIVFALTFLSVVGLSQTDLYLYVPNAADGTVSVVDLRTNQPVAAIPVGEEAAHGIAVSPDGQTVWVGGSLFDVDWLSAISVVDTRTRQVVAVVSPGIGDASHFSFTPDGQEAWIASVTNNLLWVVDTQTYAVRVIPIIQPFTAPVTPEGVKGLIGFNEVAVGPDGRRIYAISPETGVLYDLEAKTGRLIRTAQVGERAHGVVVRPDGLEIWTANRSGAVTILDAETLEILVSLPMGNYANHIAFSRDGRYAYVSRDQDVAVLDVATRTNVATVPVGNEPHELSLEDWIMPSSTLHYPALDDLVRQASSSGIQVTVTWLTPDHLRTESHDIAPNDLIGRLALFVQLDTHAGNLLRYDVAQHALLKTGDGRSIHPLHWQGISEDSHHRRGILWFLANDETGSLITEAGAGSIMLILQELGRTPERTFHWDLGR